MPVVVTVFASSRPPLLIFPSSAFTLPRHHAIFCYARCHAQRRRRRWFDMVARAAVPAQFTFAAVRQDAARTRYVSARHVFI